MPARAEKLLTAIAIKNAKIPGRYLDGNGLMLYVGHGGARAWVLRFTSPVTGKVRDFGLGAVDGPYPVSLVEARDKASDYRRMIRDGIDPIEQQRATRAEKATAIARTVTFADAAHRFIEANSSSWRNPKHKQQWVNTLAQYAAPTIGKLDVATITVADILRVLEPIWKSGKAETGSRVRQRVENVLDWCIARGYRTADNCARWKGLLDKLLPHPKKVAKVRHQPALPYIECPGFVAELRKRDGWGARCLELQILCATRSGETAGAQWSEMDLDNAKWIVPAERTKTNQAHEIPLSADAVKMLRTLPRIDGNVFPGIDGRPLTIAAGYAVVKEMRPDVTAHGFRSSFRDFAADRTAFPREVAESALNHTLRNKTEAAYLRSKMVDKRRMLMEAWSNFLATPTTSATVTPIAARKKVAQ